MTLKRVKQIVRKADPALTDEADPVFRVAVILISGLAVGANTERIARFTGYPRQFVREIGQRLRANGVWVGQKTAARDWEDRESGSIAFWLDVTVGLGFLERA